MCAAYEWKGKGFRPGKTVPASGANGPVRRVWAGFARSEILSWWQRKGGELLDLPATRFAERSEVTGQLIWGDVPEGLVIRALLDAQGPTPLVKVLTRASEPWELEKYQHPRMPVLEPPRFAPCDEDPEDAQGMLF